MGYGKTHGILGSRRIWTNLEMLIETETEDMFRKHTRFHSLGTEGPTEDFQAGWIREERKGQVVNEAGTREKSLALKVSAEMKANTQVKWKMGKRWKLQVTGHAMKHSK